MVFLSACSERVQIVPEETKTCTSYQWLGETVEDFTTVQGHPFQDPTEITIPSDMLKSFDAYQEEQPFDFHSLSPNGNQFAYTFYPDAFLYDWKNQIKTHLFSVDQKLTWNGIFTPIWSPDGSKLAFVFGDSQCSGNGSRILVITLNQTDLSQSNVESYDVLVGISLSDQIAYPEFFEFESNNGILYKSCSNLDSEPCEAQHLPLQ